jgi:hypothetical protein
MSRHEAIGLALLIVGMVCNIGVFLSLRAALRWPGRPEALDAPLTEGMVRKGGRNDLSKVDRSRRPPPPAPMRRAGIEVPYRRSDA